ncbi:prolyl oligopeptidase family serine peptidase [Luteimicrobium sp. DT211]|uniref:prolyl oligopeptidase family serine peptidase n=1 Tax=Luteimicrobium sp. DT211 TaxID=3393412 RepID=UPI003CEA31A5
MTQHALVLPGGSYQTHAPHEAEPVAVWLERMGLPATVLRYPVRRAHPAAHRAIGARVAELRAQGVERILLVGFSAGGHAAGLAALAPVSAAAGVDGVVLGYPVVSLQDRPHGNSAAVLLGEHDTPHRRAVLSLERLVTPTAPPFFVFHSFDDPKVPVEHSLLLSSALAASGVAHELHLYPVGGHGCGLAPDRVGWTRACEAWLAREGWTASATEGIDTPPATGHS